MRADAAWVPSGEGESLYLRPFAFASEAFLGVRPSKVVDYYVIASPSGSYFTNGLEPISIWVTTEYHRAGRGGTGAAKTGGNYASSLLPQQEAYAQGCDQVCFLDDVSQRNLEELGGMNIMVVDADGTVRTPRLTGTILEGSTRSAIIRLLRDSGRSVVEDTISLQGCSQTSSRVGSVRSSLAAPPPLSCPLATSRERGSTPGSRAVRSLGRSTTGSRPSRPATPRIPTGGCTSSYRLECDIAGRYSSDRAERYSEYEVAMAGKQPQSRLNLVSQGFARNS